MRTAVAIALSFPIGAQAQTNPTRGSAQAAGKARVETQAQCVARQQQIRDPGRPHSGG